MPPDPGTPADWLRHARSDLSLAHKSGDPDTLLETLCFHAQQSTEKCFKAILLKTLIEKFPSDLSVPVDVSDAVALTDYAVTTRYPGAYEEVGEDEYRDALRMAERVMAWVESVI